MRCIRRLPRVNTFADFAFYGWRTYTDFKDGALDYHLLHTFVV